MTTHTATLSPQGALFQRWRQFFGAIEHKNERSPAEEAALVRALADTYRRSDPSFASDLYAAADRHESAAEAAAGR